MLGINVGCGSTWAQTFTYDPFGNITKSGSISWTPGYNTANNHYTLGGTTYDNDGNLTYDTFHHYQWDPQGHPVVLDNINSSFDALGNLAEQDAPTWNQEYIYDENGKQIGGAVGQSTGYAYIPLPGGAQVLYSPEGSLPTIYIHADWLGSARLHSTQSRTIYGDTAFAPFGETYANSNTGDPYHFAAYPLDFALGLYDTPAREYHATQGRWITPDPAGLAAADPTNPQSWNRYAYALNNPLSFIDPTGLFCAYLNDAGNGVESIDSSGGNSECGANGGYWIEGDYGGGSWVNVNSENGIVTGAGYDSNGNLEYSIAGAAGSNDWGAWTQTFGAGISLDTLSGAANNGPTISAAPSIPWYKNPCIQKALAKGGASALIDGIGLLPAGGAVSAGFSLFHGAAAVSNGTAILGRVQLAAGIITTANGASNTSQLGMFQTALGVGGIVAGVAKAAPVVGQVISGISVVGDFVETGMEIAECR